MAVCNSNFLQATGFKLSIDRENYPNLEFLVQSVNHPTVNSTPAEAAFRHIGSVPEPGDKLEFGEVTFNIILDEELNGYSEVYNWMKRIIENNVVTSSGTWRGDPAHVTDVSLTILTSKNNKTGQFVYRDAFPTSIGSIDLEAGTSEVNPVIIPATFRFSYFDIL